jgi:hypothetical protein
MLIWPESGGALLANMSAPPRSTVMLPRLTLRAEGIAGSGSGSDPAAGFTVGSHAWVGPGGGARLSQALCVARVDLPRAVCAYLRTPMNAPQLSTAPGLACALIAIARCAAVGLAHGTPVDTRRLHASHERDRALRLEFDRLASASDAAIVNELPACLASVAWPEWVPAVDFAMPLGQDVATGVFVDDVPPPPEGVTCPLLAVRLIAAIRGPVFLRNAAPTLSSLLGLRHGPTRLPTVEIWRPITPGAALPPLRTSRPMNAPTPVPLSLRPADSRRANTSSDGALE